LRLLYTVYFSRGGVNKDWKLVITAKAT